MVLPADNNAIPGVTTTRLVKVVIPSGITKVSSAWSVLSVLSFSSFLSSTLPLSVLLSSVLLSSVFLFSVLSSAFSAELSILRVAPSTFSL